MLYAEANSENVKASGLTTSDGQDLLFNTNTLNAWLNAEMQGNQTAAKFYENRFLPEYKIAFDAWVKLDPLNNSFAPPGPRYMPQYHSSKLDEANNLSAQALANFNDGTNARSIGDSYVGTTVFLATALVLNSSQSTIRDRICPQSADHCVTRAASIWYMESIHASANIMIFLRDFDCYSAGLSVSLAYVEKDADAGDVPLNHHRSRALRPRLAWRLRFAAGQRGNRPR